MHEPDRTVRTGKVKAAMVYVAEVVDRLTQAGFPCEVVSAGGTGTYDITAAIPTVTDIQAGSYVFMDNFHGNLVPGFSRSLTVLGTVVIQHGKTIVFDSGRKSIGIDFVQPTLAKYPQYPARYFAEEHALFDVDDRCDLHLGDTAEFIPGYAPTTVNLYDAYHVVEKDVVVDVWPSSRVDPGMAACCRHSVQQESAMRTPPRPMSEEEFGRLFRKVCNWGKWGPDYDRGTLNYITPEHVRRAAGLVNPGAASRWPYRSTKRRGPTTRRRRRITWSGITTWPCRKASRASPWTTWPASFTAIATRTWMRSAISATKGNCITASPLRV